MPTTPRGFPYPTLADANDAPYWLQQLAEKIDADIAKAVTDLAGAGGTTVGTTNAFGQIAINHGLGVVPTKLTANLASDYMASTPANNGRDHGLVIYSVSPTNFVVMIQNLHAPGWAGAGLNFAIQWTARK